MIEDETDITDSMDMSLCELREMVKDREGWHVAAPGVTKSQICLSDLNTAVLHSILLVEEMGLEKAIWW